MATPNEWVFQVLHFLGFMVQYRSFEPFVADDGRLKAEEWAHDERVANQLEIWMGKVNE